MDKISEYLIIIGDKAFMLADKIPTSQLEKIFGILIIILVIANISIPKSHRQGKRLRDSNLSALEEKAGNKIKKLQNFKLINKIYNLQIHRMVVLNNESREASKKKLEKEIIRGIYTAIGSGILAYTVGRSMLITVITIIVTLYILTTHSLGKSEKRMNKLEADFPEIIQFFLDEYILTKNIRSGLKNVVNRTTGPIHNVFSTIIREIYSGVEEKEAFEKAADTIGFYYAYAFVDILTIAEEVGDITEPMNYLSSIIRDEIEVRERAKTMNFENKMMNNILNSIAAIGILYNMVRFDFAKPVYLYTATGNALIIFWLVQFAATTVYNKMNER